MKTNIFSNLNSVHSNIAFGAITLLAIGCSSGIKKSDIDKTANPFEEISKLDAGIQTGYDNQYDVLANEDFSKSIDRLNDAKEALRDHKDQAEVLEEIAYSRSYLDRAKNTTNHRLPKALGVLEARRDALKSGVKNFPELKEKLDDYDDRVRSDASNLDKDLTLKEFSALQQGYQELEVAAIQSTQLGATRASVTGARDDDADDRAPKALKVAEFDLKNAENSINSNRHNPSGFEASVTKSKDSARFLVDVLALTNRKDLNVDEDAAANMVRQTYEIGRLNNKVGKTEATLRAREASMGEKDNALSKANKSLNIQAALDDARTQFNEDEAEVYQQGGRLVIRLKSMAFSSGRADLPSSSLAVLAKVQSVAQSLDPSQISIEGHTDSIGEAKANQALSEKRASAVATYLQTGGLESEKIDSVGYGFQKPIASNKSSEGRAQNRRVDIVITPSQTSSIE